MNFIIDNRKYEILIANDVSLRDGMGVELWDEERNELLAEIFRHDDQKKVTFYSEKFEVPFEVVKMLVDVFEERVGGQI